jgi:hypothetical protein
MSWQGRPASLPRAGFLIDIVAYRDGAAFFVARKLWVRRFEQETPMSGVFTLELSETKARELLIVSAQSELSPTFVSNEEPMPVTLEELTR